MVASMDQECVIHQSPHQAESRRFRMKSTTDKDVPSAQDLTSTFTDVRVWFLTKELHDVLGYWLFLSKSVEME